MQNLPPLITLEPTPLPQRQRLDMDGSFKLIGVSEVLGEPELRKNQFDLTTIEIKDLQDDEFARNFNSPLTDLNDSVIVQVRYFNPPVIGVPLGKIMSTIGESSFTSISVTPAEGVLPPLVGTQRISIPTTLLTPASRVIQPLDPTSLAGDFGGMVTQIPSVPTVPTSFAHTTQSGPIGSSVFVQGFTCNGGHIPPSTPYIG